MTEEEKNKQILVFFL